MGAGCVNSANDNNFSEDTIDDVPENTYTAVSCGNGTKLFQGTKHDIEFCYPKNNGTDEGMITVKEDADGVVLSVSGEAMRKVWVVDVDGDTPREDIVEGYAVRNPEGVMCGVVGVNDNVDGRHVYVIVGEDEGGEQTLDTVTACTFTESDDEDGFDMNMQRSGSFFFYDRKPEVMYILTGEQDPSLGELTEEFTESVQPKE